MLNNDDAYESKANLSKTLSKLRSKIESLSSKIKSLEAKLPPDRPQVFKVQTLDELSDTKLYEGDIACLEYDNRKFMYLKSNWYELGSPLYTVDNPDHLPASVSDVSMARTTDGIFAGRLYSRLNDAWVPTNFLGEV